MIQPYADDQLNTVYGLLFCDDMDLYRSSANDAAVSPWKELFDPESSEAELQAILDSGAETRVRLLAANVLRDRGIVHASCHLYGVIVEVALPEGLDVVAVYEDGTARYINFSGKMIFWDVETAESAELKANLFSAAQVVVDQIGPWDGERLPSPVAGNARLSFLVSDGLYFGEAPFEALAGDPMGGAVLDSAGKFMAYLIASTASQSQ